MQFTKEQTGEVKAWMVKRLEDISDADPEILSDYTLALFDSDVTDEEIRKSAIENLEDFLKSHTVKFVDEVFTRYGPKSLPSSTAASIGSTVTGIDKQSKDGLHKHPLSPTTFDGQRSSDKYNAGRKRSYHESTKNQPDMHYGNGTSSTSSRFKRVVKDARTSGREVSSSPFRSSSATLSSYPFMNLPPPPTPPPGFPAFDPTNPMAAYAFMQTMFPQITGMPLALANSEGQTFANKPRCQDYDTKGYCTLGSSCPYEHGHDLIVASNDDEYDPTKANFTLNGTNPGAPRASSRTKRGGRAPGSVGHIDGRRNNRAVFSDPRLPPDKSFTSIVVEQIPGDYFEQETVRNFFSQYGKVVDVTMKPYKRLAVVKYDMHSAAKRAWESPKAVFDNRFVKVYWYRPDMENTTVATGDASFPKSTTATTGVGAGGDDGFKQQQDERQKAYEERMRVKKAMDEARQNLVRRRENMAMEREALVAKLAVAEGHEAGQGNTNGADGRHLSPVTDSTDPKIKALREQLARMQAEAKRLGIDPDAPADDVSYASNKSRGAIGRSMRGGSATRATYRGYGSPRGGYWGYGFVRGRDPSVRKLDNRPKSISISGVNFDSVTEENLRSYLTLMGPFEDMELNPQRADSRVIVFRERWMAEKVMHGKTEIPGVGKVELCWVANTAAGTAAEDVVVGDGGDHQERRIFSEEVQQPEDDNLDVAGGDDDDWGNVT